MEYTGLPYNGQAKYLILGKYFVRAISDNKCGRPSSSLGVHLPSRVGDVVPLFEMRRRFRDDGRAHQCRHDLDRVVRAGESIDGRDRIARAREAIDEYLPGADQTLVDKPPST
jgi:hypothetical protein